MTEGTIEQLYSGLADGDRQQLVSELVTSLGEDTKANVGGHPSQLAQIIEPQETEVASISGVTGAITDVKLATKFLAAGIGAASASAVAETVLHYLPAQRSFQLAGIGASTIVQMVLGLVGYWYAPKLSSGSIGQYLQAAAGGLAINAASDIARIFGVLYKEPITNGGEVTGSTGGDVTAP